MSKNKGNIKRELDDFSQTKEKILLADKINIIMAALTFGTLVFAMLTLGEMVKERNTTYEPSILINPTEYSFEWNEDGVEDWLNFSCAPKDEQSINYQEGVIYGSVNIPITVLYEGELEKLSTINVGVGTARDVVFEWSEHNLDDLNEFLIQCDESKKEFFKIDQSATFSYEQGLLITNPVKSSRLMYMLANAQETYNISLPSIYSVLIHEIIKTNNHNNDIPPLLLTARYFDVQGRAKREAFLIYITQVLYQQETSGEGKAKYQLVPAISKS